MAASGKIPWLWIAVGVLLLGWMVFQHIRRTPAAFTAEQIKELEANQPLRLAANPQLRGERLSIDFESIRLVDASGKSYGLPPFVAMPEVFWVDGQGKEVLIGNFSYG